MKVVQLIFCLVSHSLGQNTDRRYQKARSDKEKWRKDKKAEEDGENYTTNIFKISIFNKSYRDS
jgi:hypothetical protein